MVPVNISVSSLSSATWVILATSLGCTSLHQKPLLAKQLWPTHNKQIERGREKKEKVQEAKATELLAKRNYNHMEEKDGTGHSYQQREGGRGKAENGLA